MANAKHPDAPWTSREHVFPKEKPATSPKRTAPDANDKPGRGALRGREHKVGSRTK